MYEKPSLKATIITFIVGLCIIAGGATYLLVSTTFETKTHSNYGQESAVEKLVVTIVPVHREDVNDNNDVNSVATDGNSIYGELKRITIAAEGNDTNFKVIVKDDLGITLFSKTDCDTTLLPLSYALDMNNSIATRYPGITVAGPITVETNDVNASALTGITVTLYYLNSGK